MTREEAREAAEVMLAYANGKEMEFRSVTLDWHSITHPNFNWEHSKYRIKDESKCRKFDNGDECWEEMKKHEPFGWVCSRDKPNFKLYVLSVDNDGVMLSDYDDGATLHSYPSFYQFYNFVDGTRCGIINNEK